MIGLKSASKQAFLKVQTWFGGGFRIQASFHLGWKKTIFLDLADKQIIFMLSFLHFCLCLHSVVSLSSILQRLTHLTFYPVGSPTEMRGNFGPRSS